MPRKVSVAEAKRDFSELMSRVAFRGERFLIERRGKSMAALVSVEDLHKIETNSDQLGKRGLLAAVGAWEDFPGLDRMVEKLYLARERSKDRRMKKLS